MLVTMADSRFQVFTFKKALSHDPTVIGAH